MKQSNEYKNFLFGIGNPLLDLSVDVSDDYLKQYELEKGKQNLIQKKHDKLFIEIFKKFKKVSSTAGGSTLNTFRAFQWTMNCQYSTCTFVGGIGDDTKGKILIKESENDGVNVIFQVFDESQTGTCVCLITGEERTLIAKLYSALNYEYNHFKSKEVQDCLISSKMYYFSSFFIFNGYKCMLDVGKHAQKHNKPFALNLSSEYAIDYGEKLLEVMKCCTHLFGNEKEAKYFSNKMGWKLEKVMDIAVKIAKYLQFEKGKKKCVVITQGIKPICVAFHSKKEVKTFSVEVTPSKKVVDTTGAGDSFVGGFLAQLAKGKSLLECVEAGKNVSKMIVESYGIVFPSRV